MNASTCPCGAVLTSDPARCPECGAAMKSNSGSPYPRRRKLAGALVAAGLLFLLLALMLQGVEFGGDRCEVRIRTSPPNVDYTGHFDIIGVGGLFDRTFEGVGNQVFSMGTVPRDRVASATVQKKGVEGWISLEMLRNGRRVGSASTSAPGGFAGVGQEDPAAENPHDALLRELGMPPGTPLPCGHQVSEVRTVRGRRAAWCEVDSGSLWWPDGRGGWRPGPAPKRQSDP